MTGAGRRATGDGGGGAAWLSGAEAAVLAQMARRQGPHAATGRGAEAVMLAQTARGGRRVQVGADAMRPAGAEYSAPNEFSAPCFRLRACISIANRQHEEAAVSDTARFGTNPLRRGQSMCSSARFLHTIFVLVRG